MDGIKSEKKLRREKSQRSKKRALPVDPDGQVEEESRKHKKSKKHSNGLINDEEASPNGEPAFEDESKESRRKHKKASALTNGDAHPALSGPSLDGQTEDGEGSTKTKKKHRKQERPEPSPESKPQPSPEPSAEPKKRRSKDKHKSEPEADATPTGGLDAQKKSKKLKKLSKTSRDGEEDAAMNGVRTEGATDQDRPKDKKYKKKHHAEPVESDSAEQLQPRKSKQSSKKNGKEAKRKLSPELSESESDEEAVDAINVDSPVAATATSALQEEPIFPFFTQTISLYVPFYPVGFDKPITNVTSQHLDPLLNHYSPLFRGVLLGYQNVNFSERPIRANPNNPPTDQTGAVLTSVDEYAVGFGWLTADLDLFIPRRGAWMEGTVNLQSEGHIGVVCWDKFNASIEAKRLPSGWRWVDLTAKGRTNGKPNGRSNHTLLSPKSDDEEEEKEVDELDGAELEVAQMHTTGYWVDDANGQKKVGGKLRFRIKNFDVGLAGDYGYLSIEGTMLDEDDEKTLTATEREAERKRRGKQSSGGLLRPMSRRVPEFSMTRFGREDEEEDSGKRTELYKGSRPGTPDD